MRQPAVPPVPDVDQPGAELLSELHRRFADRDGIAQCVAAFRRRGGVVTPDIVSQALTKVLSSGHGTLLRAFQGRDIWTCAFARDVLKELRFDHERENLVGIFVEFVDDLERFEDVVIQQALPNLSSLRLRDVRLLIQRKQEFNSFTEGKAKAATAVPIDTGDGSAVLVGGDGGNAAATAIAVVVNDPDVPVLREATRSLEIRAKQKSYLWDTPSDSWDELAATVHSFYCKWDPKKAPTPFLRREVDNIRIASEADYALCSRVAQGAERFQPHMHMFNPPAPTVKLIRKFISQDLFLNKDEAEFPIEVRDEKSGKISRFIKRYKITPMPPREGQYEYQEQKLQRYLNNRYVDNNCFCRHVAPPMPECGCWGNYDEDVDGWCKWSWKILFLPGCIMLAICIFWIHFNEIPSYRAILEVKEDFGSPIADLFDVHVGSNSTSGVDSSIYAVSLFATREGLAAMNNAGRFNEVGYESDYTLDSHGIFEIFEEDMQSQGMRLSVLFGEEASFQNLNRRLPHNGQLGAIKIGYKLVPLRTNDPEDIDDSRSVQTFPATVLPLAGLWEDGPELYRRYGRYWNGAVANDDWSGQEVAYRPFTPSCKRTDRNGNANAQFEVQNGPSLNMVCITDFSLKGCNTSDPAVQHSCIAYRNANGVLMWGPGQGCIYGEESCQAHTSFYDMAPDITRKLYGSVDGYQLPTKNFASGLRVEYGKYKIEFTDIVFGVWLDKPSNLLSPTEKIQIKNHLLARTGNNPLISFGLSLDKPAYWAYICLSAAVVMMTSPLLLGIMILWRECYSGHFSCNTGGMNISGPSCGGNHGCGGSGCNGCISAGDCCHCCCDGIECCCEAFDSACKGGCDGLAVCCEGFGNCAGSFCESLGSCGECCAACAEGCAGCGDCGSCNCAC